MRFYGLLGEHLSHSISPEIHHFLFRQLHIEAAYCLFPVAAGRLADALQGLRLLGAGGVNVTIPYKVAVMPLLDELSDEARRLGAVNTILFEQGRAIGYNTDYAGFGLQLTRHGIGTAGKTAIVLGTGGAAQTAACWLGDHGAEVKLVSREPAGGGRFPVLTYQELAALPPTDILVNATPVGMYPRQENTPLEQVQLSRFGSVVDLIYNPLQTRLLREADALGIKTVNGLSMLAAQAVAAEEIWQGRSLTAEWLEPVCQFLKELPAYHNLILIGMPGSGKSSLGRLAAETLGWEFCDTDEWIEQRASRSIPEIFRLQGEAEFRRLETEAVRVLSQRRRAVIATGGGCVLLPENMAMLASGGRIVYLDRPVEQLITAGLTGRPLLEGDDSKLHALYAARKGLYEQYAYRRIENSAPLRQVLAQILEVMREGRTDADSAD